MAAAVAQAWAQAALGRPGVEAELRMVAKAATRRLGEDGVRELVRSAARGAAQDRPVQREGLAAIGRAVAALGEGQRAHAGVQERAREVEQERLGLRRGPRLGM